jgi:catechol 2,3-dioxygenase-like lactoylglutathione lyase family enzyme
MIVGIHHAQIMIPPGQEAAARAFYCDLLGLAEIEKPPALRLRGGFWLAVGDQQLHIGVEQPGVDRSATRAHVAYAVRSVAEVCERLAAAGIETKYGEDVPGLVRAEFRDPFGNRVEIVQRIA